MKCRHCGARLVHQFLDLGCAPPSNAYLDHSDLDAPELYFPLQLFVCDACWLAQTRDYSRAEELFKHDYAYFSSISTAWLSHAEKYCSDITNRLQLNSKSFVVEVASNDGYLLRNFVAHGIPCLGIEPTASTAEAAEAAGIPVLREFFGHSLGTELQRQGNSADLIIGNNVYAHVPDINDFTHGLKALLKAGGTITLEFPHLLNLIEGVQFDTVYHEHYSYFSLTTVSRIFSSCGLRVWDVDQLPTHGGSLRIYGCHAADERHDSPRVERMLALEKSSGLCSLEIYSRLQSRANSVKDGLLTFLINAKKSGKSVAGYGAAAKGNTLLNYAGVRTDLLPYVCDAAPSKQGKYLPGSRIPIVAPGVLAERRPDYVLILPWNLSDEVIHEQSVVRSWGGQFAVAIPQVTVKS